MFTENSLAALGVGAPHGISGIPRSGMGEANEPNLSPRKGG
jgi:hypothetical protein